MNNNRQQIFDEMARIMTDTFGLAQGVKREAQTVLNSQFNRILNDMDVVSRDDFEILRDVVLKLKEQNMALEERIAALEGQPQNAHHDKMPENT